MNVTKKLRLLLIWSLIVNQAFWLDAQIAIDDTLDTPAQTLSKIDQNYDIKETYGKVIGNNLFHSFSDFNVGTGETAMFTGSTPVTNILARVTGGNASSINGSIDTITNYSKANFFFINPNGIIFGEKASLNIGGATTFSTADYIKLDGTVQFDATNPNDPPLTTAPPEAFGFLEANAGDLMINKSELSVSQPISLIARDIEIDGGSIASSGSRITLVSTRSEGEVALDATSVSGDVDVQTFTELGNIKITDSSISNPGFNPFGPEMRGGRLVAHAKNLTLDNSSIISANSASLETGRSIEINSESLDVINGSVISTLTIHRTGGDIELNVGDLSILSGSRVNTFTVGPGDGGNIVIGLGDMPTTSVRLQGEETAISAQRSLPLFFPPGLLGTGSGGNIVLNTQNLDIASGATINTATNASGSGGKVSITANTIVLDRTGSSSATGISSLTVSEGASQGIEIESERIELNGGAQINATSFVTGLGGDISLKARTISIDGNAATVEEPSGVLSQSSFSGNAGQIEIEVDNLELHGESRISTTTDGAGNAGQIIIRGFNGAKADVVVVSGAGSVIDSQTQDAENPEAGNAGEIRILSRRLEIADGGAITTLTSSNGDAGQVVIDVDDIRMSGGQSGPASEIASQTLGPAKGGDITIRGSDLQLNGMAQITTESEIDAAGDAGNIDINVNNLMLNDGAAIENSNDGDGKGGNITLSVDRDVILKDSLITARSVGDGGNIFIDSKGLVLNNSDILASAVERTGGNISIETEVFLSSRDSTIDASSEFGVSGVIDVIAPDIDIAGSLAVLPESFFSREIQLQESCAVKLTEAYSSFITVGRGGTPFVPGGVIPILNDESE